MKITSVSKYVKISSSKVFSFARLLKGVPVAKALAMTKFSKAKAAALIGKTLKSAIANAENNQKLSAEDFRVKNVIVERGPRTKRYWSRSRGMARPIYKPTSHIRVSLVND